MSRLVLVLVFLVIAAAASLAVEPLLVATPSLAAESSRAPEGSVAVGRIFVIEPGKGFVIAQFPEGPRLIYIQRADVFRYKEGDEIRVDSFGRIQS